MWRRDEIPESIFNYYDFCVAGGICRSHFTTANRRKYLWADFVILGTVHGNCKTSLD